MNEEALAQHIAAQVLKNTQFWIAIVGFTGTIVGCAITVLGNFLLHYFQERKQCRIDKERISLLNQMLTREEWGHLSTMSRVIGTSQDETRRLLIELGARGSEIQRTDGEEAWALISKKPLNQIKVSA